MAAEGKLPKPNEIIEIVKSMQNVIPKMTDIVSKFNKDIKVKDALQFSNTFPIVLNTFMMAFWELNNFTAIVEKKSLLDLKEFINDLLITNSSGNPLVDEKGNVITIFTPIGSMISSITAMLNAVNMGDFIKLPITLSMVKTVFNKAFKLLEEIMNDNWAFLAKIKTDQTIKKVIETEKEKTTEEISKPGTGGIFKELTVIFKSMSDVQDTIIKLASKALRTMVSVKIVDKLLENIQNPFKKIMNLLEVFTSKGGVLGRDRIIFDARAAETVEKNWKSFENTVQGVFNTFIVLGLKSVLVIIAFAPIRIALWLMTDFLIPAANKLFEKISDKNFNKNLINASLTILLIGSTLLTMATILYVSTLMVRLNFEDMFTGLGELILCFGLVTVLMLVVNTFLKPADLIKATSSIAILSGAILLMAGTLYIISIIKTGYLPDAMLGLIGLTLFSVGLLALLKFVEIGVNNVLGGWMEIMKTLVTITLAVILMSGVLWVIDRLFKEVPITDILSDLLILGVVTGSIIGMLYIIKNAQIDIRTIITIGVMTLAVLGIAGAISIVTSSIDEGKDILAVGAFVTATMALVGLFIAVGGIISTGVGATAIYLAIGTFMAIGAASLMIAGSFKIIVDAITDLVDLMDNPDRVTTALGNFPVILKSFVEAIMSVPIATILKAVVKANALALAIGPATSAIGGMVNVIKEMADGEFEFNDPNHPGEKITMNVLEMMNSGVLDKIGENLTNLIEGFATAIASIDWSVCKKVMNREDFMEDLGEAVGPVYDLVDMVKSMAEGTVEIDGEQVNFVDWINANQYKITESIQTMIMGFANALSMGMGVDAAEDWWDDVFEEYMDSAEDGLDEVPKLIKLLTGMTDGMLDICTSIDELRATSSFQDFSLYLSQMCQGLVGWYDDKLFEDIEDVEEAVDTLVDISGGMVDISENLEKLSETGDAYNKFIDGNVRFVGSINKLDTSKANALANVFGKLAELSDSLNGNFDKLAEAISDKLIGTLQQLNDTIQENSASTSGIGGQLRKMVGGAEETGGGILNSITNMFSSRNDDEEKSHKEKIEDLLEQLLNEVGGINDACMDGINIKERFKE